MPLHHYVIDPKPNPKIILCLIKDIPFRAVRGLI